MNVVVIQAVAIFVPPIQNFCTVNIFAIFLIYDSCSSLAGWLAGIGEGFEGIVSRMAAT